MALDSSALKLAAAAAAASLATYLIVKKPFGELSAVRESSANRLSVEKGGVEIFLNDLQRFLPKREVKPGVTVALFNPLGDWALNEALGVQLVLQIPKKTDLLLMPDGKAQALLHVLGRNAGLPTLVAKKEVKPYMKQPVLKGVRDQCMTSKVEEAFYLGDDDAQKLKGKNVLIVDDVVSTGGSIKAIRHLLQQSNAKEVGVMCAYTEGGARDDVIALGNLPVNAPEWK